jgi:hypothetical protein
MGDRSLLADEVGKLHLEMSGPGLKHPLHLPQDLTYILDCYLPAIPVQDLHKSAHMGASKIVGQIAGHRNPGHGVLAPVSLIREDDGIAKVADSYLVDLEIISSWFSL